MALFFYMCKGKKGREREKERVSGTTDSLVCKVVVLCSKGEGKPVGVVTMYDEGGRILDNAKRLAGVMKRLMRELG